MLHAMHYFMSRIITFSKSSAEKAVGRLRKPQVLPFAQALTSTLLNLQIKQAMQLLHRETTRSVLAGLEKVISAPKKANWADTFCVVLVLCICLEAVQVASDCHAMAALRDKPDKCGLSRAQICQDIDSEPFKQLVVLFHIAHKTHNKSKKGFNPIRNELVVNQVEGITPLMVNLVNEIKEIMRVHGKYPSSVSQQG
jgi:hypothetical protein